jgi:hypothetical protein
MKYMTSGEVEMFRDETSDTDSGVSRNDIFRVYDKELTNPVVNRAAEN